MRLATNAAAFCCIQIASRVMVVCSHVLGDLPGTNVFIFSFPVSKHLFLFERKAARLFNLKENNPTILPAPACARLGKVLLENVADQSRD